MLIYHDPNSIIREAYQKILMGGKYLLESSSTAKSLILKKLDEEPDYIPKAYNYILKNIPDHQIATIYQKIFGKPMRGRASRARGQITDELGFNTNGINFLLKYAPTHVINYIGGWFDLELRADADSEETQDTNTQASEKSNNYIVDEIIVKLKDLKLNNNSLYTIYRKILKSVSDKTALYTAARNLYNKKEDYYDIGAVLVKAMQEQRGTFILSDFANILRYLDVEDLKKANSIVDEYIAQKKNSGQQNQGQSQSQTQQTQQQAQQTPQVNGQTNDKPYNINITTADISKAARQVGVKLGAYGDKVFGYKRPMCEPHVGEDIMQKYLTQLFKNVAKVGYAKAREDFVAQLTAKKIRGMEDLMKVADQINANSSKIQRDTEQVKKAYQNGMTPSNQPYVDQHKEEYLTTREKIDADREELRGFLSGNYRQTPNTNAKTNTKTNTNTGTNTNNQVQKSNSQVAPNNKTTTTNTTNNKMQQPKQQTRTDYFHQESFPSEEI